MGADVGDLASIFFLALLAMLNPTLLAAVTMMLLLPSPKKLMLGYLLGAYLTSITIGLLIVFSLDDSGSVEHRASTRSSPIEDIVVGLIALIVAYVLGGGRTEGLRERRRRRKEEKKEKAGEKESWPERMLGRGDPRITFALGVVLSFPGVSYLAALDRIAKLDDATLRHRPPRRRLLPDPAAPARGAAARLRVRARSGRATRSPASANGWRRNGRRAATIGAAVIGALLRGCAAWSSCSRPRLGEEAVGLGDDRVAQLADAVDLDPDRVADLEQPLGEGLVGGADAGRACRWRSRRRARA